MGQHNPTIVCDGKTAYASYHDAARVLRATRRRKRRRREQSRLGIYRCPCCRDWHIGGSPQH